MIKGRIERLEGMINGLLEYARIGKVKRGKEKVDVKQMVIDLVEVLVPRTFDVKIGADLPFLNTDRIQLEQVFANLLSNAVKYNDKEAGQIQIDFLELTDLPSFITEFIDQNR